MIRKARRFAYYAIFLAISLAVHLYLFFPRNATKNPAVAGGPPPAARAAVEVAVATQPQSPAPPEKPPEKPKEVQELEKRLAEHLELFKELQFKMKEMEELQKAKENQLAAEKARQEDLEKQLAAVSDQNEKARKAAEEEAKRRDEEAAKKVAELEEKLARAAASDTKSQEDLRRQMEEAIARERQKTQEDLAKHAEAAKAREDELKKELARSAEEVKEREEKLDEQLARQTQESKRREEDLKEALARQSEDSAKREDGLKKELARQAREEVDRALAAERTRGEKEKTELEEKVRQQVRTLAHQRDEDRILAANREKELLARLETERDARIAAEKRREAELAELRKRIEADRESAAAQQPASGRTSPKPAEISSMDEYKEYVRPHVSKEIRKEGVPLPIPSLSVSTSELADLIRYFQFRVVIYPEVERERNYFVEVALDGSGRTVFTRDDDGRKLFKAFVLRLDGIEFFERMKEEAAAQSGLVDPNTRSLAIAFVTPEDRAHYRYLLWKSMEVCKANGRDPGEVAQCYGVFRKTSFGAWVFLIDQLVLDTGEPVPVKDFESEKVFGG